MTNRRTKLIWSMYDFSTSISIVVFLLYFSQWLVVDKHLPDIWYNLIFVGASILLFLTVPAAGIIADRTNRRVWFLQRSTAVQYVFLLLTGAVACYGAGSRAAVAVAAAFYLFGLYAHQFALVFYDALLPSITATTEVGRLSGIGQSAKSLGTVVGVAISIPLAHSSISLLGSPGRTQALLPATIISFLLTIPVFFLKEPVAGNLSPTPGLRYKEAFARLRRQPNLVTFLVGFFLFNDAILAVQDNLPIYMQRVLLISDQLKAILLGAGLLLAAVGGAMGGKVADRLGLRRILLLVLAFWAVLLPTLALVKNITAFSILCCVIGLVFGLTWTVARALMAKLAPSDQLAHGFGYYGMLERFSTLIGPVAWGMIVSYAPVSGSNVYRVAMISMTLFVVAGLLVLLRLPPDRATAS